MWCDGHACVCSGSGYSASILPGERCSSLGVVMIFCAVSSVLLQPSEIVFLRPELLRVPALQKDVSSTEMVVMIFFPMVKARVRPYDHRYNFWGLLQFGGLQFPTIFADTLYLCFSFLHHIFTNTLYSIIFSLPQILDHHDLPEAEHLAFLLRNSILCKIFPGHWQPKTSIITVQCQNGYIGKVATIGDTPIFHFQDYGRKYVHMPLQEFPQSSFSICRRPGTWCLKYHCVIRETSSFTKQRHFGGSCGIGLHQPPCLWWRACHPQRPRKNPHGGPPLGGRWTHDFRLRINPKKGEFDCRIREKRSFLLLLIFIIFSFNIFKGLLNIW